MKKLILSLIVTLGLFLGFNSVNASEVTNKNSANIETSVTYTYVKVYENGAIWVYVYEDGIFVGKYLDE